MKVVSKDIGPQRWLLILKSKDYNEEVAFKDWMDEHCPECMCVKRFNDADPFWEVRGGEPRTQTLILLRWTK